MTVLLSMAAFALASSIFSRAGQCPSRLAPAHSMGSQQAMRHVNRRDRRFSRCCCCSSVSVCMRCSRIFPQSDRYR